MFKKSFKGGLILQNPFPAKKIDLIHLPLPDKVVLSMQQRIGEQAKPCVKIGDKVLTGQVVATISDNRCSPVHSSISGTVVAIENKKMPEKSKLEALTITIESDGKDEWIDNSDCCTENYDVCTPETIYNKIRMSGIVGMGGAGFPTHTKVRIASGCDVLLVNATECEPGIMCDDSIMQAYPTKVIRGTEVLLHICGAKKAIIAIEDDKKDAINLLKKFCKNDAITIEEVPTKYTCGSEKILIRSLLGIEIPSGKYASDVGVLCHNVGTLVAIFDAVIENRPLISRAVTLTGDAIKEPQNFEVRLGATYDYLFNFVDIKEGEKDIMVAGTMMGIQVDGTDYAVNKNTNCIVVNKAKEKNVVNECIRCGVCNNVCPIGLLPQQLYWYSKSSNIEKALEYNLMDCIECGCCSYSCPSNIPLVDYYQFAKALNKKQQKDKIKNQIAKERFEFRQLRLERNKKERAEMMEAKKKLLQEKMAKDNSKKDLILAAKKRAEEKKIKQNE